MTLQLHLSPKGFENGVDFKEAGSTSLVIREELEIKIVMSYQHALKQFVLTLSDFTVEFLDVHNSSSTHTLLLWRGEEDVLWY